MHAGRAFAITLRHLYLLRSSVSRIVPIFAWVTIDMILWGFITRYLNTLSLSGLSLGTALLAAVVCWGFFGRVMHGVSMAFFEDVWSRNFLNVFIAPLSITEYITGLALSSVFTSLITLFVLLVTSSWLFDLSLLTQGPAMGILLLTLFLFGIALGIAGCALVLRFGPPAEWFIWPIPAVIAPFVGVFYPVSILPDWMRMAGRCLPPSYAFENLRALIVGTEVSILSTLPALELAIIWLILAALLFYGVCRHAMRSGLIARYSAEHIT
ncbi:MAG: ABC transporter permease [Betaproteobacteria bacterium]|nr:ABC transporter permease [Betaproteobacteria bacterium]